MEKQASEKNYMCKTKTSEKKQFMENKSTEKNHSGKTKQQIKI